jgi:hypothetical protein
MIRENRYLPNFDVLTESEEQSFESMPAPEMYPRYKVTAMLYGISEERTFKTLSECFLDPNEIVSNEDLEYGFRDTELAAFALKRFLNRAIEAVDAGLIRSTEDLGIVACGLRVLGEKFTGLSERDNETRFSAAAMAYCEGNESLETFLDQR